MADKSTRYDEEFKKSIVSLYNNGKTQAGLCKEYGVSSSALGKWIKQYSIVKTEDGDILSRQNILPIKYKNQIHFCCPITNAS